MRRSSRKRTTVLGVLVAAGLLSGTAVRAGSPPGDAVAPRAPLERDIPTQAVSSVLENVAAAREQIAGGATEKAIETLDVLRKSLERALMLSDERAARVHLGIRAILRGAERDDDHVLRVRIEQLLEQLEPAAEGEPAWLGQQRLREAKRLLEKGDRAGAIEKLGAVDPELRLRKAEVPLDTALDHVLAAIDALQDGRPQDADAQLAALEQEARFRPGQPGAYARAGWATSGVHPLDASGRPQRKRFQRRSQRRIGAA